jgi:hypothetical protein
LDQLLALCRRAGLHPWIAAWFASQQSLEIAWNRTPRLDWLQAIASALGCDRARLDAANAAAHAVHVSDSRGTELTEQETRCAAYRRHVTALHVVELLLRLPAEEPRTGVRLRVVGGSGRSGVRKLGGGGA